MIDKTQTDQDAKTLARAESIAQRMAATSTGLDKTGWLIAAALLHLSLQDSSLCKAEELYHNASNKIHSAR